MLCLDLNIILKCGLQLQKKIRCEFVSLDQGLDHQGGVDLGAEAILQGNL